MWWGGLEGGMMARHLSECHTAGGIMWVVMAALHGCYKMVPAGALLRQPSLTGPGGGCWCPGPPPPQGSPLVQVQPRLGDGVHHTAPLVLHTAPVALKEA